MQGEIFKKPCVHLIHIFFTGLMPISRRFHGENTLHITQRQHRDPCSKRSSHHIPASAKFIRTITMDTASKLLNETSPAIPAGHPAYTDAGSDGQADSPPGTPSPMMSGYILIAVMLITTGVLIHYTLPSTDPSAKPRVPERVLPIP